MPGLLDFIEYLLDWSRNHPLFIITLARPELADKRSDWGAGKRSFTSLYLEPLSPKAMDELLSGLVPGLHDDLRARILDRAEGVPLYAVETVRMLLDRGLLVQEGNVYHPTGPIETLEVPQTLHALIAARLDGLTPEERRLIQDGSVLGKTFTMPGICWVSGRAESEVLPILSSLVRKEVLSLQADPRSPERGQYGFLQDLVKWVAYETLSKRERKAKRLAAAAFIESTWSGDEDEIVEVVAAHYLEAYREVPDAPDAEEIKNKTRDMLARAGERAESLAAPVESQRYFEQAADLADDPVAQAELLERAGMMAKAAGHDPTDLFERAIGIFESRERTHPAARVAARLAEAMWDSGRLVAAVELMDRSFEVLSAEEPDEDFAALAAQLGRMMFFAGKPDLGFERIDVALEIAESLWLPEVLSQALNTKAVLLYAWKGRRREALALLRFALEIALEHDLPSASLRAYYNTADIAAQSDRYQEALEYVRTGLELARKVGNRHQEWLFMGQAYPLLVLGEWDEILELRAALPEDSLTYARQAWTSFLLFETFVRVHRGEIEEGTTAVDRVPDAATSADVQEGTEYGAGQAVLLLANGRPAEALAASEAVLEHRGELGISLETMKEALVVALEAALALNDLAKTKELLDLVEDLPRGKRPQFLEAQVMRFRARLAADEGDSQVVEPAFKGAVGLFREMAAPFYIAVTLLEHAEWLASQARAGEADPLLAEARKVFGQLKARPWLQRLEGVLGRPTSTHVASS